MDLEFKVAVQVFHQRLNLIVAQDATRLEGKRRHEGVFLAVANPLGPISCVRRFGERVELWYHGGPIGRVVAYPARRVIELMPLFAQSRRHMAGGTITTKDGLTVYGRDLQVSRAVHSIARDLQAWQIHPDGQRK